MTRSEARSWSYVVALALLAVAVMALTFRSARANHQLPVVYVCIVHDHDGKVVCRSR